MEYRRAFLLQFPAFFNVKVSSHSETHMTPVLKVANRSKMEILNQKSVIKY